MTISDHIFNSIHLATALQSATDGGESSQIVFGNAKHRPWSETQDPSGTVDLLGVVLLEEL